MDASLIRAMEELVTACETDMAGPSCDTFEDDEAVGGGDGGDLAVTFGMIRRARAALSAVTRG